MHEAQRYIQQMMQLGRKPGGIVLPDIGYPTLIQAEIQREWNELDAAHDLIEEALSLSKQTESIATISYLFLGYAELLRVSLSRGELDAARAALRQVEHFRMRVSQPWYIRHYSIFTTVDQIRLWLACGELEQATRWAEELDLREWQGTPFTYEREEIARIRILLAKHQPALALRQLESVLQRTTTGKRWGHVIEIRLLQALAHQMCQQETEALDALSEAVRLAEPEGYIRSFIDEGTPMETLLYRLRKRNGKYGPTPYLDTLLAAFQQESMAGMQAKEFTKTQQLPDPLSKRELEVLQLLAQGISNQDIAQELVIAYDTVKRHVSHIFSKLGVSNRVQAVRQARALGLFDESPDMREV